MIGISPNWNTLGSQLCQRWSNLSFCCYKAIIIAFRLFCTLKLNESNFTKNPIP
jgi:hypothetical protein